MSLTREEVEIVAARLAVYPAGEQQTFIAGREVGTCAEAAEELESHPEWLEYG